MMLCLCSTLPPQIPKPTHLDHATSQNHHLKQARALLIKTNAPLSHVDLAHVPAIVPWNSCLKFFAERGAPCDTISLFLRLRQLSILPDHFTCSFLLKACTISSDIVTGRIIHAYVQKLGFQSNLILQNMLLHLYASCGETSHARLMFDKMPQQDVATWNIMIGHLISAGDVGAARDLFDSMPRRNVRSWTSVISGLAKCGMSEEALRVFSEMEREGSRPNEVTVVAVLVACAQLGDLEFGKSIHRFAEGNGFLRNVYVCNALIDMYVKCGCLEEGCRVFDGMRERTVVSWSSMIVGFAMHGEGEKGLELYEEMIRSGMKPNHVTFIGVLHACSHVGLVDKGREFFTIMRRDYGIVPGVEHYGCLVDLLSRAGRLEEAREVIANMSVPPNGVVWGALLGGCRLHKNIKLAEEAMRHLSELDPLNDGYYVVMSNVYAEAGKWEEVSRIRRSMKSRGVKKTQGCSSITIDGVVHEFVAGDETHPQAKGIFEMWEKLLVKMKMKGYIPDTSVVLLDMEDEQKEIFLYRHSEKLALVYGLINTKPGMPIRIMKNLRVCEDCHTAFKLVSEIENREIVVRDRNRFHCFKNGACTCKDYW
ncbi:pentatricopeptide repeat-containing protein At2g29760, chloroplastic-like [Lotus japonicus]|uniref:pentatricopeptide repeat-containing protein At2g29760, chloroplastic-like n=1 Tax=Lotus japonicus TaxID=34305 RepID=UPI002588DDA0|nr:pentatricopeptide repeat-containing protein At2g29760, chloroplastic-like [Lotus japonicus]